MTIYVNYDTAEESCTLAISHKGHAFVRRSNSATETFKWLASQLGAKRAYALGTLVSEFGVPLALEVADDA
jgi:hypothetical protein